MDDTKEWLTYLIDVYIKYESIGFWESIWLVGWLLGETIEEGACGLLYCLQGISGVLCVIYWLIGIISFVYTKGALFACVIKVFCVKFSLYDLMIELGHVMILSFLVWKGVLVFFCLDNYLHSFRILCNVSNSSYALKLVLFFL